MSLNGDWICGKCQHYNFFWRKRCQSCNKALPPGIRIRPYEPGRRIPHYRSGDWFCNIEFCRAHNYAYRGFCYKCGTFKNMQNATEIVGFYYPVHPMNSVVYGVRGAKLARRGWKPGDWFCGRFECKAHNFDSQLTCFRCGSSRELINHPSLRAMISNTSM